MPRPISSPATRKQLPVRRTKPAWSDYLTEDNKFALSNEEALRRKQTLLSKHNVFNGNSGNSITTKISRKSSLPRRKGDNEKHLDSGSKGCNSGPSSGPYSGYYDDDEAEGFPKGEEMDALDLVSIKQNKW